MPRKSTRKTPKTEIPPEERAALLSFHKQTKSLSMARGEDIVVRFEVDLSARYARLLQEIKAYKGPIDIRVANKVHSSVFKSVPKPPRKIKARLLLTRESVSLAAEVLGEIVRRCAQRSNHDRGLEALIKRYGSTLADFALATDDGFSWAQVTTFFRTAASSAGLNFESLISEENLGPTFTNLKSGVTGGLLNLLRSADAPAARQLLGVCAYHSELDEACRGVLRKAMSEYASTLPRESQQVAMRFLDIREESAQIDYANPAESPEIKQAAALLLYLFDTRHHSAELEEAFDRYRVVAERQFNLYLRGDVGSTMPFDSRLHEPPESGSAAAEVTVVRPWVEWYKPPDARVVIRGIVEPNFVLGGDRK